MEMVVGGGGLCLYVCVLLVVVGSVVVCGWVGVAVWLGR
jgi:hypothetical protein